MGKYQQECDYLGIIHSQSVTIDELRAEIAALKSVSLEPVFLWHKVDNEDECDVFDYKDIGHTDCQHCIPLYTAEQINKMATKDEL